LRGTDAQYGGDKQAITGLPSWVRGVQVFANASAQRVTGDATATTTFAGYIPHRGSRVSVAAFEPAAKTWSHLSTSLSLRSNPATLCLETR